MKKNPTPAYPRPKSLRTAGRSNAVPAWKPKTASAANARSDVRRARSRTGAAPREVVSDTRAGFHVPQRPEALRRMSAVRRSCRSDGDGDLGDRPRLGDHLL